jgi:uncharacterized protein
MTGRIETEAAMDKIDVWAQILTERMANAPWLQSLYRWTGRPAEDFVSGSAGALHAMDAAGVEIALLSAWYGPTGPLISNEEVAQQLDAAPERFRGLASADIRRPARAVQEIRRWIDDPRFVGVRIVPWLWDLPPNDRRYYPIYATCVELGIPLCTQIGHTGPLLRSETGRPIPYLEDVLLEFPELVVVGGHLGFPWIDELVSLTLKFPNFFVDTSAYVARRFPPAFVDFMKGPGRKRVMFGTNWPMLSPALCLEGIDGLTFDDQTMAAFLSGTARKVFSLER